LLLVFNEREKEEYRQPYQQGIKIWEKGVLFPLFRKIIPRVGNEDLPV